MKHLSLTQGQFAIVDDGWYDRLMQIGKWQAWWNPKTKSFYAVHGTKKSGKPVRIYMHRVILGLQSRDEEGDHINRNTLDNQTHNLRSCSHQQNGCNREPASNNTTGYKGVSRYRGGRWRATIKIDGRFVHLGYFDTSEAAARAYDFAAREHFKEFAFLNFPNVNVNEQRRIYSRQ